MEASARNVLRPVTGRRIKGPEAEDIRNEIAVWFRVTATKRPRHMDILLDELAQPDFRLDDCKESAQLGESGPVQRYSAHWFCRFSRQAYDAFADVRLLKRLAGAGFDILRFDAAATP